MRRNREQSIQNLFRLRVIDTDARPHRFVPYIWTPKPAYGVIKKITNIDLCSIKDGRLHIDIDIRNPDIRECFFRIVFIYQRTKEIYLPPSGMGDNVSIVVTDCDEFLWVEWVRGAVSGRERVVNMNSDLTHNDCDKIRDAIEEFLTERDA